MKDSDLHTHSLYSDGELSPSSVVKLARSRGIKNLALTDHNSVEGVNEAIKEGERIGVSVIPGIEIRAEEDEVLGYFIDYENKEFKKEIESIQNNLINRVKKIIVKLNKLGIKVSFKDLLKKYNPNKNFMEIHLIKYLESMGLGKRRDLWKKFISESGETFVPIKEISVVEVVKLIRKYGGVPVLAHPWVEPSSKKLLEDENFQKLIDAGLLGIELDNGDRDERRDKRTVRRIKQLAKKYNLIVTSGSDFHIESGGKGDDKMSKHNCSNKVVNRLVEAKQSL